MLMWAFMNFQKATCEPAGKAKKPSSECLISHNNIQAVRVAIESSVITNLFNISKYLTVTVQLLLNDNLLISACIVYCQFLIVPFTVSFNSVLFVRLGSFVQYSNYSVHYIFCPDLGNVFQVFQSCYTPTIKQSINIIQQTAPSFVLV